MFGSWSSEASSREVLVSVTFASPRRVELLLWVFGPRDAVGRAAGLHQEPFGMAWQQLYASQKEKKHNQRLLLRFGLPRAARHV